MKLPIPQMPRSLICVRGFTTSSITSISRAHIQAKIAKVDAETPFSPSLVDSFRRRHDYLRISLTERCNLRCFYCMPSEGIELSPQGKILTNDEILRLATLFVKSGVTKIRLTGGEPTIRKGIAEIIASLSELRKHGLQSIAMTSNGLSLHRRLPQFIENGLSHLNLSLDTLDPFKFEFMTRRRGHDAVLRSLDIALASPFLKSVKLNVVVIKGLNDSEVLEFVEMTRNTSLSVRFIEFMPFTGNKWDKAKMIPFSELLDRILARHPNLIRAPDELSDTARSWKIPGYQGSLGFISSMSDHFCATCNRLRITADGQIKVCLFDAKEVSLRDEMRRGASDEELLRTIGRAVLGKQEKHVGMEDIDVVTNRPMILIGGPENPVSSPRASTTRDMPWNRAWPLHFTIPAPPMLVSHRFNSSSAHSGHPRLTHFDNDGHARMVDVAEKQPTKRTATATGRIYIPPAAYELVASSYPVRNVDDEISNPLDRAKTKAGRKGDVLAVAQLAAIMGCKRTSDLIPLCHPLAISHVSVTLTPEIPNVLSGGARDVPQNPRHSIVCTATVSCEGKTGVEMEALTAVSVGLLTVWDMLKAVAGKEMEIGEIVVTNKTGGRGGDFVRQFGGHRCSQTMVQLPDTL